MTEGFAIEAQGLRKPYGDVEALAGIDLRAPSSTVLGLLGSNGAGKTTAAVSAAHGSSSRSSGR